MMPNGGEAAHTGTDRPLGVWLFAICNIAWSVWGIVNNRNWDSCSPSVLEAAPYALAMWCGILISAAMAWYGSRVGRTALLVMLGFAAVMHVPEDYRTFIYLLEVAERHPSLWHSPFLWFDLTFGRLLWAGWCLVNCWYFLGSRTRAFYARPAAAPTA
jgi:hypothetical protein